MIAVKVSVPPDEDGRFVCWRDGWMEHLTLDEIKAAIARGETVEEWK